MKVVILGAGIIGVTTAYELLRAGYEVSIIDRQLEPAMETSFGNAGLIAPGHSYAWTTPKLPGNLLISLLQKQRAFRFKFHWDPAMWRWGLHFLYQCTHKRMAENTLRKHRLCSYSQKCFHQLVDETNINYHENRRGLIYFFRSRESFREGENKLTMLKPVMNNLQLLNRTELFQLEPTLEGVQSEIYGGIYCPTDESGDCRKFTLELANICKEKGVVFHYDTTIEKIEKVGSQLKRVFTSKGDFQADIYILSLAAYSSFIAQMAGDYLPVYPIKGYSFTVPIKDREKAPVHGGIDEDNMLAFSLMGDKIRFTSVAEICGFDTSHKPSDFEHIVELAHSLFPGAFDFSKIQYWAGLRPMTPNGSPIFGTGKIENLFYNTGHGHLGWTMAAGSAKITADLIAGVYPEINLEGMVLN